MVNAPNFIFLLFAASSGALQLSYQFFQKIAALHLAQAIFKIGSGVFFIITAIIPAVSNRLEADGALGGSAWLSVCLLEKGTLVDDDNNVSSQPGLGLNHQGNSTAGAEVGHTFVSIINEYGLEEESESENEKGYGGEDNERLSV